MIDKVQATKTRGNRQKSYLLFILTLTLALSSGCQGTENKITSSPVLTSILAGTSWTLKSLGDKNNLTPLVSGKMITLRFVNSASYMGSDGNDGSYGAGYKTEGHNIFFATPTFAGFGVQDEPPGFLKQYQDYFNFLRSAQNFEINNNELLINCRDDKSISFSRIIDPTS